jgi:hypothetical protein
LVAAYRRLVGEAYLGAYRLEVEAYRHPHLEEEVVEVHLVVSCLVLGEPPTLLWLRVKNRQPVAMIATIAKFLTAAIHWFLLCAYQEY